MRLTVFAAVAVGSVVALVGFASAANASATIDLIWADTDTDTISGGGYSSAITLRVILTAGPNGSQGAGVSVDYSEALSTLSVIGYASTPGGQLPIQIGPTTDSGTQINNINSACFPPHNCTGLAAGDSTQLGTVQFHKGGVVGSFELLSVIVGTDDVLDLSGNLISDTTTLNSAFLINAPYNPYDGDGVGDAIDNCSETSNAFQDDTDLDDCGNLCDADYNQTGIVDFGDFGFFTQCFGTANQLCMHVEPILGIGRLVSFGDFGFLAVNFGRVPGPSGTTAGTTACP